MDTATTTATDTDTDYIYEINALRISSQDDHHWFVEWSYQGRADLIGAGWVAVITAYDPGTKYQFERQFVDKQLRIVKKSRQPIILQCNKLFNGGSKYGYDKYGGESLWLSIHPDGKAKRIKSADAVTMLAERTPTITCTFTQADADYLLSLLADKEIDKRIKLVLTPSV